MPILTRLFSPSDLGSLAVYVGIITTISVSACLRFDIAISLPEKEDEADSLLKISILCAFLTSCLILIALNFQPDTITQLIPQKSLHNSVYLIPIGVFICASTSAIQNWHIRNKTFKKISTGRLIQSITTILIQSTNGLLQVLSSGLIIGYITGFCANMLYMGFSAKEKLRPNPNNWNFNTLLSTAKKFVHFPIFSTWEALANQAAIHLPIIIIASAIETKQAGYLMLAMSILQAPISLFGASIAQVYLSHAAQKNKQGELFIFTKLILSRLILLGTPPIATLAIFSPFLFPTIFGEEWKEAGKLVAWMSPWFLMQLLVSPISMSLHIIGAQRVALALQITILAVRTITVLVAIDLFPQHSPEAYAMSGAISYSIYLFVVLKTLKNTTSIMEASTIKSNGNGTGREAER